MGKHEYVKRVKNQVFKLKLNHWKFYWNFVDLPRIFYNKFIKPKNLNLNFLYKFQNHDSIMRFYYE